MAVTRALTLQMFGVGDTDQLFGLGAIRSNMQDVLASASPVP